MKTLLLFIAIITCMVACSDKSPYRVVEMEDGTYRIQEKCPWDHDKWLPPRIDWYELAGERYYVNDEEGICKLYKQLTAKTEKRKGTPIKRVIKCQ